MAHSQSQCNPSLEVTSPALPPALSAYRCSCGKVSNRNHDAIVHIAACHYGQIYLCPMGGCPIFRATLRQMREHLYGAHSSRVAQWTTQQVDHHLDVARRTVNLQVSSTGRVSPPYATLRPGLPLPLDICPFVGKVERPVGAPARRIQLYLKRQEVSEAIQTTARVLDSWPLTPQVSATCPVPQLYRVPPDFQLGDGPPPAITTTQLVFATPAGAAQISTPVFTAVPTASCWTPSASHVTQLSPSGRPLSMTSSRQQPYPPPRRAKAKGTKKERPSIQQSCPCPPPLMAQRTYPPVAGVDPAVLRRAATYLHCLWDGRNPPELLQVAHTALRLTVCADTYHKWKASVEISWKEALEKEADLPQTPTSPAVAEPGPAKPLRPVHQSPLNRTPRVPGRHQSERPIPRHVQAAYSTPDFNEPMVAAWLLFVAHRLPEPLQQTVLLQISRSSRQATIGAFWTTLQYLHGTGKPFMSLRPELFAAPLGTPAPCIYRVNRRMKSRPTRDFEFQPGYVVKGADAIIKDYGLSVPHRASFAAPAHGVTRTRTDDVTGTGEWTPDAAPAVRGTLAREVQQAFLKAAQAADRHGPQAPPVATATTALPVPKQEANSPPPAIGPMEVDDPVALTPPVSPVEASPADGTPTPLPKCPPTTTRAPAGIPAGPSAIFYNCALPALPPGALRGLTTDTLGRFLLPAGLSISFPLLPSPTPDCPKPELICGSFTLMTPVPIYARLDHLPWTGDWDRYDRVASELLANPRVPEPRGTTPHEDLMRTLDALMQNPGFVSTAAQAPDLAQHAATYFPPSQSSAQPEPAMPVVNATPPTTEAPQDKLMPECESDRASAEDDDL